MKNTKPKSHSKIPLALKVAPYTQWRKNFEPSLTVNRKPWKAFQRLVASEEAFAKVAIVPWNEDCRGHALKKVYLGTCPDFDYGKVRKNNDETRRLLRSVLPQLETLATHIRKTGTNTPVDDGVIMYDLSDVISAYESVQAALDGLTRPYTRPPNLVDQCMGLLEHLESLVPQGSALALARLAMKAHGYRDDELDCLSEDKVRSGHIRKRKKVKDERSRKIVEPFIEKNTVATLEEALSIRRRR